MKRGLCLALVDALELLSAADWNILIFHPKCRIRIFENKHQRDRLEAKLGEDVVRGAKELLENGWSSS
jgi:hypothetical protein